MVADPANDLQEMPDFSGIPLRLDAPTLGYIPRTGIPRSGGRACRQQKTGSAGEPTFELVELGSTHQNGGCTQGSVLDT